MFLFRLFCFCLVARQLERI